MLISNLCLRSAATKKRAVSPAPSRMKDQAKEIPLSVSGIEAAKSYQADAREERDGDHKTDDRGAEGLILADQRLVIVLTQDTKPDRILWLG